jgi:uncharacterized protein (TIGR00251 family)
MKLQETAQGVVLEIYVKPNSKKFKIELDGNEVVVLCCEAPVKGKVNKELLKHFSRLFGTKVELVFGFTSRQKRLLISDAGAEEVEQILASSSGCGHKSFKG